MEAGTAADKKTRKHTEGTAAAVQAKHGNSCSAKRVQAGPTRLTSFDMKAEPLALPHRDNVLVDKDTAVPKQCLSPVEMRTQKAASSLLPAGTASAATRTTFHQLPPWFCPTEEIHLRTSDQYATDYSSCWKIKAFTNEINANSGVRSWRF